MLLPFGARYPQDKVTPPANMPKNVKKKMRGQRTCLFCEVLANETYETYE
jgi:hypothetical protein